MVDFGSLMKQRVIKKSDDPIEIYNKYLDRKSDTGSLRTVQNEILTKWYTEHKDDKELIIKLSTGAGKTLIGLLILQSKINANEGPCLYVCPNNYLFTQVCNEANKFGIPYTTFEQNEGCFPDDYLDGKKILITNSSKVFNGATVFDKDRGNYPNCILLDDSHACIETIRGAFTVVINRNDSEELYTKLFSIFRNSLSHHREGSFIDLENGDNSIIMRVPYWTWAENKHDILKILSDNKDKNKSLFYAWNLIRDNIDDYCCHVTFNRIEISPYNLNVNQFNFFNNAKQKILMSATTQDDSFFITNLGFEPETVKSPLTESDNKWSGEKMVIIPSLINDECNRDIVINNLFNHKFSKEFGKIVIVPNSYTSRIYTNFGGIILDSKNIETQINNLKNNIFPNVLVLNNRYDGIDLPDDTCRLLVIDSLPYFLTLNDQYEKIAIDNSEIINKRLAQKIEQGFGRGVRGEKDYCAIIVIGSDLVHFLKSKSTKCYFSQQTQKQIAIGERIASSAKVESNNEKMLEPVYSLIEQLITRDDGWKQYYNQEMSSITDDTTEYTIYERLKQERKIYSLFAKGDKEKACEKMQCYIDTYCKNNSEKGWYLQELARLKYYISEYESTDLQKAAFNLNNNLLRPRVDIPYTKLEYINCNRLDNVKKQLIETSQNGNNDFILEWNKIIDNLAFGTIADKFEEAVDKVGKLLGFVCQRPDKEIGKGPDNLWCISINKYFIIECKDEVEEGRIDIKKSEAGQMNTHIAWFKDTYGNDIEYTAFEIITTKYLAKEANFFENVKIIRETKMKKLQANLKKFIGDLNKYDLQNISNEILQKLLDQYSLNPYNFIDLYSEEYVTHNSN